MMDQATFLGIDFFFDKGILSLHKDKMDQAIAKHGTKRKKPLFSGSLVVRRGIEPLLPG
jgi:hypothetical protein